MGAPFQFDPATHAYSVDCVKVPSVTQVLEGVGISDFSSVPLERLQYAKDLGTAVHAATEAYDQDDLDWASIADTVVEPYLQAWVSFRAEMRFTPRLIEHRGVAAVLGQRYGFTVDREGECQGFGAVLDIKTGEPSRSWAIQTAAYEEALQRGDGRNRRRFAVRLLRNGAWKLECFTDQKDRSVWHWALALETWKGLHA